MLRFTFYALLTSVFLAVASAGGVYWWIAPQLPSRDALRDVRLQTPLKVYSEDGLLIAEFGEKHRLPVTFAEVPDLMVKAFLAAEDDRFFEHPGVDWTAIVRAAWQLLQTGEKRQGGSTITMQVARNYYLTLEKTYTRKLKEIILSLKLEREFSKPEILEMYLNQIFLGQRAYGVAAAAQIYYDKPLAELTLAEIATIAALPKAPSSINPVSNPQRAEERRGYVLGRMRNLGFIDQLAYDEAMRSPVATRLHGQRTELDAPYVAEMVRTFMQDRFGTESQTDGFRVYTTISSALQAAADKAIRNGLTAYDMRHGYRGKPEHRVELLADTSEEQWAEIMADFSAIGDLLPALVIAVDAMAVDVFTRAHGRIRIAWEGLRWARPQIDSDRRGPVPASADQIVQIGDVVRIQREPRPPEQRQAAALAGDDAADYWRLSQIPEVEGALISMSPNDGEIFALVGGFDFNRSNFNRALQARRQPGSNFKPFIYSAALEQGFTTASIINDAPIVMDAPGQQETWRPENYGGRNYGPTTLREALYRSRNLVSIRLLKELGIEPTLDYLSHFGFDPDRLPHSLSLSLGSAELTPLEIISGYAIFANGGYRVEPYFVARVERDDGEVVYTANPPTVCRTCDPNTDLYADDGEPLDIAALRELDQQADQKPIATRVVDEANIWIMNSILRDVIRVGTGTKAQVLKRADLQGKTGTTNDLKDAWFTGFNPDIVTTAWIGFDQSVSLGNRETGAVAALPMWIDFMGVALQQFPERLLEQPPGVVTVRINPRTGYVADADDPDAVFEVFRADNAPRRRESTTAQVPENTPGQVTGEIHYERLF